MWSYDQAEARIEVSGEKKSSDSSSSSNTCKLEREEAKWSPDNKQSWNLCRGVVSREDQRTKGASDKLISISAKKQHQEQTGAQRVLAMKLQKGVLEYGYNSVI